MNIQGQAALVTGGGSGLGEATARELARLGAKVAVLDVNLDNAKRVAADIGGVGILCDITDTESLQAAPEFKTKSQQVAERQANTPVDTSTTASTTDTGTAPATTQPAE